MQKISFFSMLIRFSMMIFILGFIQFSQGSSIPDPLRQKIDSLASIVKENRSAELKRAKDEVVTGLSDWIIDQISMNSPSDLIRTLNSIMPVTSNEHTMTWKERKGSTLSNNIPIKANLLSWNSNDKEVLAIRFDCHSDVLRKSGYLESYPPIFIAKDKDGTYFGNLSSWKYSKLGPTFYTLHGLIAVENDTDFPDILFSTCPMGSGSYVYFGQMHFEKNTKNWEIVWQTVYGYIANIEYSDQSSELKIDYFLDKFNAETTSSLLTLKWGGY